MRNRFGKDILIVDTPGIFDTTRTNDEIKHEIKKCIGITAPGPHAFVLVVSVTRYTPEELNTIDHFFSWFGDRSYEYFIILFTSKERLDKKGKEINDHIKTCPEKLRSYVEKCGNRVIAFNNLLLGDDKNKQVQDLLSIISNNVKRNEGKYYTNEMYKQSEENIKRVEAERMKKAEKERTAHEEKIREQIKAEIAENEKREGSEQEKMENLKQILDKQKREMELLEEKYKEQLKETRSRIRDEIESVSYKTMAKKAISTGVELFFDYVFG